MKVKELREMLEKCLNQDAEINFIINPVDNGDLEEFDIQNCNADVMGEDIFTQYKDVDQIDIIVTKTQSEADKNNSLKKLFFDYGNKNLKIMLNPEQMVILVTDIDDESKVYREIEMNDNYYDNDEVKEEMLKKLFAML